MVEYGIATLRPIPACPSLADTTVASGTTDTIDKLDTIGRGEKDVLTRIKEGLGRIFNLAFLI